VDLVKSLDKSRFSMAVAAFYSGGALGEEMQGLANVRLIPLGKKGRWDLLFLRRLWSAARDFDPDIVYSFMGVAGELGLILGKLLRAKVVWGLRTSYMDFSRYDWAVRSSYRFAGWLSRFPDLIIANSWAGHRHHVSQGYSGRRMIVIPNGVDAQRFCPCPAEGRRLREEWGIADGAILIGLVGRLDPMKDHPTFLRAAGGLAKSMSDVRFVCVGGGSPEYSAQLRSLSEDMGLSGRLLWTGSRSDMTAVYSALDIAVSSSYGEGFPNVVAEAMACGVPCVVSDVGDSARIVEDTGWVFPPRDPDALRRALESCLAGLGDKSRPAKVRDRIMLNFSCERLARETSSALEALLHNP
jgi:glycosyltransferase involved in cell wall biosynthesis